MCSGRNDLSIRLRLLLWYSGLLVLLLSTFGGILYAVLQNSLLSQVDRTLAETAQEVQAGARRRVAITPFNWQEVVTLPPLDVFASPSIFVQVRYPAGIVAATSANLRNRTLPVLPAEDWQKVLQGQVDMRIVQAGNVRLQMRSEVIAFEGRPAGVLQVAMPLRSVDETLQRLLEILLIGGGIGLLLSILGGIFLSHRALAPVAHVTETARRIAATEDLGERLPPPRTRDEVGRLVLTFNEMLERLQRLFQAQQRFIADVSHELRTPLAAIRGNLEVLLRGAQEDPEMLRESLADIEREVSRLTRMVTDLLTLARAEAGIHPERRPVELDRLLLEVYREARHLAQGVEVRLGNEDQVQVLGDADQLKQLLLNLVDNSLKYTPAGGTVTLSLYREDSWACLSVADTGIGIAPQDLPHIFERFYRGESDGRRVRRTGLGLGLPIARWIAQEHGGDIVVESRPGQGSTFTVRLPLLSPDSWRNDESGRGR